MVYRSIGKKSLEVSPHSKGYTKSAKNSEDITRIIEYNKIGDTIKKRINELTKHHFKEYLFSNDYGRSYKNASRETLKVAEYYLTVMGQKNKSLIKSNMNP